MDERGGAARAAGLTKEQVHTLRAKLDKARADAQATLTRSVATARAEDVDREPEPMDLAEVTREQDDGALFVERERGRLRDVEAALAKIEAGTYGVSERTGDPIGYERLAAVPWARFEVDEADDDVDDSAATD
jgi:DnaK suppressor protein